MKLRTLIRLHTGLLACLGLWACAPLQQRSTGPLQVIAIDVEGGAATLYVTPEGKSLLIDTGWPAGMGEPRRSGPSESGAVTVAAPSSAERIIATARKAGLSQIDFVLITHFHLDHVGGFSELISKFPVGTILDHGPNREVPPANLPAAFASLQSAALYPDYERLLAGHAHQSLKAGDEIAVGSMTLTVVSSDREVLAHPLRGAGQPNPTCAAMIDKSNDGGEENPRSVGVVLTFRKTRVVALGDLTWNMEKALVCPVNRVGVADVLIVSHHGSSLSNSPALLRALSPRVAVMNNGALKGGDPETHGNLIATAGLQRLWQLHFAAKAGNANNSGEAYIANLTNDPDVRAALRVLVYPSGKISVINERTGFSERYLSRAVGSGR